MTREQAQATLRALARQLKPYGLRPGSKSGEARRYDRVAFDNVLGRFSAKRQSVIRPENVPASDSPERPMTHDASEASLEGYDAMENNDDVEAAPEALEGVPVIQKKVVPGNGRVEGPGCPEFHPQARSRFCLRCDEASLKKENEHV